MKVIFAGTPDFSVGILEALIKAKHDICAVYTQPDRPKGRGLKVSYSPVKQKALEYDLPIFQPKSLKSAEAQAEMAAFNADVMVVVAYGLILPKAILDIPKHGCLNVHASLLPKYRGASPLQAAILKGDTESGVTIMQMDVGLDTGDMLLKKVCAIGENDTIEQLHDSLSQLGGLGIIDVLSAIDENKLKPEKQDDLEACYAGKIKKQDALIDWCLSAQELHNQIRAFYGWPVSYSYLADSMVRIWQSEVLDNLSSKPGQILEVSKDSLVVGCGVGALSIKKIQLPNSKPMFIKDCLNSKRSLFNVGSYFSKGVKP